MIRLNNLTFSRNDLQTCRGVSKAQPAVPWEEMEYAAADGLRRLRLTRDFCCFLAALANDSWPASLYWRQRRVRPKTYSLADLLGGLMSIINAATICIAAAKAKGTT